jgi:SAM-dependent methyltransferase
MTSSPKTEPFARHHQRYERWFERHDLAYISELLAVRALLPWQGQGLEIGVGTGRFAAPLGVEYGIDPAFKMLAYARQRGIKVLAARAEALPFQSATFDYALIVTTICFVDDPKATLDEAFRAIKAKGMLVIGFIDRESALGQDYLAHQAENVIYRDATFYSTAEIHALLQASGFKSLKWVQTLFRPLGEIKDIEPMQDGFGLGAFVAVRAQK